jgi:Flp pilus assembly protein CpaB
MKAKSGRFLLILGAGLAALAFVVAYILMSRGATSGDQNTASVPEGPEMRTIVVAKGSIPAFTVVDSTNSTLKEIEASTAPADAVDNPEALYGMMTLAPVSSDAPLLPSQLSQAGFSTILAKGERGYSLPVQEADTFGNGITEGDRVDVLITLKWDVAIPWRSDDGKLKFDKGVYTSTKVLLQNIKVVRVVSLAMPVRSNATSGGSINGDDNTSGGTTSRQGIGQGAMYADDAPYATSLILAVTDQQAEVLKFARENGIIDLTLRSSAVQRNPDGSPVKDAEGREVRGDSEIEKTTGITADELVKQYGLLPPPPQWNPQTTP